MVVDEEDLELEDSKKKKLKAKHAQREKEEAEIAAREAALADVETLPESADDFEKLLLTSPNSSYVWIQYMAFQVCNTTHHTHTTITTLL